MASSDPGSDSDVPESFSLTQAKKTAQSRNKALKQSHADEKRKKKERNRTRDRGLKVRAELRKRERAENDVVSKMERAMRDAREENSEVDEDRLEMSTEGANEDEIGGEMGDEDEDEDIDSDDEIISNKISEEEDLTSSNPNPKHLPEHLFASTFIPTPEKNKISASRKKQIHKKDTKKRRPHRIKPKDFVLGSRTVRSLSSKPTRHQVSNVAPSSRVQKFVDRSLGMDLKSANGKNGKKWVRRPVNTGVLKRTGGPAVNFARAR